MCVRGKQTSRQTQTLGSGIIEHFFCRATHFFISSFTLIQRWTYIRACPVALGHGVSAQQGALKVAHSDTLGRLGLAHSVVAAVWDTPLTLSNSFSIPQANMVRAPHHK